MTDVSPAAVTLEQHEAICAALGMLVGLAPQCTAVAVAYFKVTRMSPLERLSREPAALIDAAALVAAVRTCLQLLRAERSTFAPLWSWTPLYDCIQPDVSLLARRLHAMSFLCRSRHAGWPSRRWSCCMA